MLLVNKAQLLLAKIRLTLKREGGRSLLRKIHLRLKCFLVQTLNKRPSSDSWKELEGKFKGETVFLLGNGPSLNETPLYLLKDQYTMVFNRFTLMLERLNWSPTFYSVTDDLVLEDILDEVSQINNQSKYSFFPDIHFRGKIFYTKIKSSKPIFWLRQKFGMGFSDKLPQVFSGGSVIYEGLQILKFLGFKRVILLGVDMNFKVHKTAERINSGSGIDIESKFDDDPNHFDPRYFGKGRKYHQPEDYVVNNILRFLQYASNRAVTDDFQIINAGYNSKVQAFPREDFEGLFDLTANERYEIFNALIKSRCNETINSFESKFPIFEREEEINNFEGHSSFYTTTKLGIEQVRNQIHDYLPMGPYEGKYYFINRKNLS